MLKIAVSVILCIGIFIATTNGTCIMDQRKSLPRNKIPIYLKTDSNNDYSLFMPDARRTTFETYDRIYAYCPKVIANGEITGDSITAIICGEDGEMPFKPITCNQEVRPEIIKSEDSCYGEHGQIWDLGYSIPTNYENPKMKFAVIVSVCYDTKVFGTIYTFHIMNGRSFLASMIRRREPFLEDEIPTKRLPPGITNIDTLYTKRHQMEYFTSLYGLSQNYISDTIFLTRGHLAPAGDFIYNPEKRGTFFLVNAALQFNTVNNGNWNEVEKLSRAKAAQMDRYIGVLTGIYGKLYFTNYQKGTDTVARLADNSLFYVPAYYYKILLDVDKKAAIVFITQNNPYSNVPTTICANVCFEVGIEKREFSDYSKGYTICCNYDEFVKNVNFVGPPGLRTLSFPLMITFFPSDDDKFKGIEDE